MREGTALDAANTVWSVVVGARVEGGVGDALARPRVRQLVDPNKRGFG